MPNAQKKDQRDIYYWPIFTYSFLCIAQLACKELLKQDFDKYTKKNEIEKYEIKDLYISIIFNIKHSLELFIKTLSIFAYGTYDTGHDITILFTDVQNKIKNIPLTPTNDGYINKTTTNRNGFANIYQEQINSIPQLLQSIKQIIEDFDQLIFLNGVLVPHQVIHDEKNDIFRYPINAANLSIDWDNVIARTDHLDIQILLQHINDFYSASYQILKIFHKYKLIETKI